MLPSLARLLIRLGAPSHRREDLLGDLEELHAARLGNSSRLRAEWVTTMDALAVASAFLLYHLKERADMANWLSWLDIKLALRQVRKRPFLEATAVLALAVGIGIAVMGFTLLDAVAFSHLPYDNGDRFLRIDAYSEEDRRDAALDLERYHMLIRQADTLDYLGVKVHTRFPITHPTGEVESVIGAKLEPGIFGFLPSRPLVGRTLIDADGAQGARRVALIGESLWRSRYGSSTDVIGTRVEIAGEEREIVGVMPDDFRFPNSPKVWLPLDSLYVGGTVEGMSKRAEVIAVMERDTNRAAAREQISRLSHQFEDSAAGADRLRLDVVPYTWDRNMDQTWLMMGASLSVLILVLVVIAANVGNLFMVRTASRTSELAVRTALGAGRARLVMQLMAEVAILVGAASVLGFVLANTTMAQILAALEQAPFWLRLSPNPRTVVAAAFLAAIATLAAGLGPSLGATRQHLSQELKAGGRGGGSLRMGRLAATLTIVQMAISVACVGTSLIVVQGALHYMDPDIDLATDQILTSQFGLRETPEEARFTDNAAALAARRSAVLEAITRIPGVHAVGATTSLPGETADSTWIHLESADDGGAPQAVSVSTASLVPGFLTALDVTPHHGRFFDGSDLASDAHPVAVVNDLFVTQHLGQRQAVGQRLRVLSEDGTTGPWIEIVGVAPNLGMSPANPDLGAGFYLPMQPKRWMSLAMRVEGEPAAFTGALRKTIGQTDANTVMIRVQPLADVASEEALTLSLFGSGLVALGTTALVLSLAGIFAMTSLAVSQRTREIGIRVALGASRREILAIVSRRASIHLVIGSAIGVLLGSVLLLVVESQESGLVAQSPWGLGATALVLGCAALLACAIPAREALRVDPARALAQD